MGKAWNIGELLSNFSMVSLGLKNQILYTPLSIRNFSHKKTKIISSSSASTWQRSLVPVDFGQPKRKHSSCNTHWSASPPEVSPSFVFVAIFFPYKCSNLLSSIPETDHQIHARFQSLTKKGREKRMGGKGAGMFNQQVFYNPQIKN